MMRASHGLMLAVVGLLVVATVMVNSASLSLSGGEPTTLAGVIVSRHTLFAALALVALVVGMFVPVDRLLAVRSWHSPLVVAAGVMVLMLALVHVPGIGREVNGARRWISLGPIGLQPSEIAKWVMPLLIAAYAVWQRPHLGEFRRGFVYPLGVVSVVCGIIALEDLGTAVLIEAVAIAMLLAAGVRWWHVAVLAPAGLLAVGALIVTSPYRVNRILAYLDPYADSQGIGYHIIQSMSAIAGGGAAGRGLGNSVQKFGYLPEGTTDFIYSIICEELGLVGAGMVLGLYILLVLCGVAIVTATARREPHGAPVPLLSNGAQLAGMGIVLTVGLQALINVTVVTGLAPTKGIALPLMSRGGTGWILTGLSLGMLVALERMADRRRRELGVPVPGEPAADPVPA
jgi:cell division protein FtsW